MDSRIDFIFDYIISRFIIKLTSDTGEKEIWKTAYPITA